MSRPSSENPTELELQILTILWGKSPQTVRNVRDALADQGRDLVHTSVITTLGTMVEKRQLERLDPVEGKAFRFAPVLAQDEVSRKMLGDLKERVFGGSAESIMLSLFDLEDVDEVEIKRLRRMLNQKLKERKQ